MDMLDTTGPEAVGRVLAALNAARRVVVIAHEHPDGDALGSALALAGFLRGAGHDAVAVGLEPLPDSIAFLAADAPELVPARGFAPEKGDLVCLVDCNAAARVPFPLRPLVSSAPALACIDHHIAEHYPTEAVYAVSDASSTAELVWNVAQAAGWPATRRIAEALWTGIVTDTGRFSYPSTHPSTLRCAADLLGHGVRTSSIADECFHLVSARRLRLEERLIRSLEFHAGGRVAIASLGPADYAAEGATVADSENFVNVPRFVRGVEAAVFLYSFRPGRTNLSVRTVSGLSAAAFCAGFGGGGHERAAGAAVSRPLADVREEVLAKLLPLYPSPR